MIRLNTFPHSLPLENYSNKKVTKQHDIQTQSLLMKRMSKMLDAIKIDEDTTSAHLSFRWNGSSFSFSNKFV